MNPEYLPTSGVSTLENAYKLRLQRKAEGKKIVLTNGCFDLLHAGHVHSLQEASKFGDELWVALNSDSGVKQLKGTSRPIYLEEQRALLLCALSCVKLVFLFDGKNLSKEIRALQPDFYVKAGDYSLDNLNKEERSALKDAGSKIEFVSFLKGISTSSTISKICAS